MKSLILMYVYYDINGDIKAITPSTDHGLAESYSTTTFPLEDVEQFLTGKENPFNYQIKITKTFSKQKIQLIKKALNINYVRTSENYLTKISEINKNENIIIITNNINDNNFSIEISKDFKKLYIHGTDEEKEAIIEFINKGLSTIYITRKNNPYVRLFTISFNTKVLYENDILYFTTDNKISNTSAYTKKFIESSAYGYRERQ